MRKIQKILIGKGKKHYVKDLEDFHTGNGIIKKEELSKDIAVSDKGETFTVINPTFPDLWQNLKRGPQIIQQKDIGLILAKTGINKNSVCVDAGGGSGSLCLSLANIAKEVTAYEINPEHYKVIHQNMQSFGITNLELKQGNVYERIEEKNVDVITLDLPEPWRALEHVETSLKKGGHLVIYLPNLTQIKMFIDACRTSSIRVIEIIELLERKWKIHDQIMRPEHEMLGHTAFLVFCRKF